MIQEVKLRFVRGGLARVLADILLAASDTVTAGVINAVYAGLFTDWPGFSLDLLRTDLTEPLYGGYARQLAVWGAPVQDSAGRPVAYGGSLSYHPTDATASSTVIGAALYDAATVGNLLAVGLFTQPLILGTTADLLELVPRVAIPGAEVPDWGAFTLIR